MKFWMSETTDLCSRAVRWVARIPVRPRLRPRLIRSTIAAMQALRTSGSSEKPPNGANKWASSIATGQGCQCSRGTAISAVRKAVSAFI